MFSLVNEAAHILEEVSPTRRGDIDIVYIYGYGFPRLSRWPDELRQPGQPVQRRADDEEVPANPLDVPFWEPAPLIKKLVAGRQVVRSSDRTKWTHRPRECAVDVDRLRRRYVIRKLFVRHRGRDAGAAVAVDRQDIAHASKQLQVPPVKPAADSAAAAQRLAVAVRLPTISSARPMPRRAPTRSRRCTQHMQPASPSCTPSSSGK